MAIHVESEEALETLKSDWPEESYEGGSSISVHENADIVRCVFKNVAPFLTTDTVNLEVERQTGISVNSRRLRYTPIPHRPRIPRIDKYLDSWLNRTQFVKVLTDSHSP